MSAAAWRPTSHSVGVVAHCPLRIHSDTETRETLVRPRLPQLAVRHQKKNRSIFGGME